MPQGFSLGPIFLLSNLNVQKDQEGGSEQCGVIGCATRVHLGAYVLVKRFYM